MDPDKYIILLLGRRFLEVDGVMVRANFFTGQVCVFVCEDAFEGAEFYELEHGTVVEIYRQAIQEVS